ncbi:MAG: ATP-binding sensor histidine kinase [Bdellovibrionia bacterium]
MKEDFDGRPLREVLKSPLDIGSFLTLAIRIARSVAEIHQQNVIHKNLNLDNILVNLSNEEVKIANFGVASQGPSEKKGIERLSESSLPFISPEQTGRVSRSIDDRSDLYSLGIIFFKMITGQLPFQATEPLEWVYCHIARRPPLPSEIVPGLPNLISELLMKLMAKNAEDRYQSPVGLQYDLERCLHQWMAHGQIEPFPLAQKDISHRFQIPQKLYGRESELGELAEAFNYVAGTGQSELVLVSGDAGMGKSSLVQEIQKLVVRKHGFFIAGKFDQYKSDIPYAAVTQALHHLVLQLPSENENQISSWRQQLQSALGVNAGLVIDLVPQLEFLLGPKPPAPNLSNSNEETRFHKVLQTFLNVLTSPGKPIVLFLDDLQWLDTNSIKFIQYLITDPETQGLLMIGAFRENEIPPSHPLTAIINQVGEPETKLKRIIRLEALSIKSLNQITADTLHCETSRAYPITELIFKKTQGNPLFFNQFLTTLYHEGLIKFEHKQRAWMWDIHEIQLKNVAENVVDLMVQKIKRFPRETQEVLCLSSCIGTKFNIQILEMISDKTKNDLESDLADPIHEGLIFYHQGQCKFLHDRVQQAAYSLIPEDLRPLKHLTIGRHLLSHMDEDQINENVFDILNQLNRGVILLESQNEKNRVSRLNLLAGRRARSAAAYLSATKYFTHGTDLLASDSWDTEYQLTYDLYLEQARCEWFCGHLEVAAELLSTLLANAQGCVDQAGVYQAKMELQITLGQYQQGVLIALAALSKLFNMTFPIHPTQDLIQKKANETLRELQKRSMEDLFQLPVMTDPEIKAAMNLLVTSLPGAYMIDYRLSDLFSCHIVALSLRFGYADTCPNGYIIFGAVLGQTLEKWDLVPQFAKLACLWTERPGFTGSKSSTYFTVATFIYYWIRPAHQMLPWLNRAYQEAIISGEMNHACWSTLAIVECRFFVGDSLTEMTAELRKQLDFTAKSKYSGVHEAISELYKIIQKLQETQTNPSNEAHKTPALLTEWKEGPFNYCYPYFILYAFLFGNYKEALVLSVQGERLLDSFVGQAPIAQYHFYSSLTFAADYDLVPSDQQKEYRDRLNADQTKFQVWQKNCPENFLAQYALISAEIARIDGMDLDAMQYYEQAIRSARKYGAIHIEAIAYEIASRFYRARKVDDIADTYVRKAQECYAGWGATAKVQQLERLYPNILKDNQRFKSDSVLLNLELPSIVKAAQSISSEVVLDKLVCTLLQVVLEQSGAQTAQLIIPQNGALNLSAIARMSKQEAQIELLQASPVADTSQIPASLIYYCYRTGTTVILNDADMDASQFSTDPYFQKEKPKSILCIPIIRQKEIAGILYLENSITSNAFIPKRMKTVELLASQAAISIQNAQLFDTLQKENIQRKEAQEALRASKDQLQSALIQERQSRIEAEKSVQMRDNFLMIASHELRTPLTPLKLYLDLVKQQLQKLPSDLTPKTQHLLKNIDVTDREVNRLSQLVENLLDISKITAGQFVLKYEDVDLSDLVMDVVNQLKINISKSKCEINLDIQPSVRGMFDRLRIEQVVTNLLTNAMKFGAEKPIDIAVSSKGNIAEVSIRDHGIGIAKTEQARIFEAFERAVSAKKFAGLGLGLYITKEIISAHGGTISITSEPGEGACFKIELPFSKDRLEMADS